MSNGLQVALERCQARKDKGLGSVVMSFSSWKQAQEFFPPGLVLGNRPNSDELLVLFDLDEVMSALKCMLEFGICTRDTSGAGGGPSA